MITLDEKGKTFRTLKSHPEIKTAYTMARQKRLESDSTFDGTDRRKVLFVRSMSGVPSILTRKYVKGNRKQIDYIKDNFDFDSSRPAFRSRNTFYYLVDIQKGQMHLTQPSEPFIPALRFKILKKGLVSQLVSGLDTKGLAEMLIYILLAGAAFGFMGYIIGNILPIG